MKKIIILLKGNINYDSRVQKEIETFVAMNFNLTLVQYNWEPISYQHKNLEIIDVNLGNYWVPKPQKGFFNFLKVIKFWHICSRIIRSNHYDYIHCNNLDTLGTLYFLPKKYYKNVIYDAHDLFPELFLINSIRRIVWNYIERQLIQKVNIIIVPERGRAEYLRKKYKLKNSPFVINNFPRYQTIAVKDIRRELDIAKDKKIICYQGLFFPNRNIEDIIYSLKFVQGNIILILFGYAFTDYEKQLKEFVINNDLRNRVVFYGRIPAEQISATIAQCDIGIALYQNVGINQYLCAPNKVFDYLMAGLKIICNDYPPLRILKEYKFVRLLSEVSPSNIADSVKDLLGEKGKIPENVKQIYSWGSFNDIFKKIYQ